MDPPKKRKLKKMPIPVLTPKIDAELSKILSENPRLAKLIVDAYNSTPNPNDINGAIFHYGKPPGLHECSRCGECKENSNFRYYNQRVDRYRYLSRSNALCSDCSKQMNSERKTTLDKATKNGEIGEKPLPGDKCPKCERNWGTKEKPQNWHRDHDAINNVYRGWLCGLCNMAQQDHRLKIS